MKHSPEQQFLLELISFHFGIGDLNKLGSLIKQCNIERLERVTAISNIEGFIYLICTSEEIVEFIPRRYLDILRQRAGAIALQNSFICQNGIEVIKMFNEHEIEYILVKGIVTLNNLYEDDMMRAVSDLDILIDREGYSKVAALLQDGGFFYPQAGKKAQGLTLSREEHEQEYHEIEFVKDTVPFSTCVDLHFDLSGFSQRSVMHRLYPVNQIKWFDHTQTIEIDDCPIRCLSHEMALLNMIYHFSIHHTFRCLKWLVDICRMIVKYNDQLDWDLLYRTVEHPNLRKLVGICLTMVQSLTGIKKFGKYRVEDFGSGKTVVGRYMGMMFEDVDHWQAVVWGRMVRFMLPVAWGDKMTVLGYNLFDKDSIAHRIDSPGKHGHDLMLPLRLAKMMISELFAAKK